MKRTILPLLLLAVGCSPASSDSGEGSPTAEPELWTLSEAPALSIGVVEGDDAYQLHSARSSRRMEDGRIAVLNGGSREVRIFDADGTFLTSFGQEGDGPGEFRGPTHLHLTDDGGFRVWDSRLRRYSYHAADGTHDRIERLRADPSVKPFPADVWYYRRHLVDSPVRPDQRGPVATALQALPAIDTVSVVRYVWVTEQGRMWTTEERLPADNPAEMRVWSLEGEPLATVTLPAHFEPHDIGPDYVLGRAFDELDVNYIQRYRLEKPADTRPGPGLGELRRTRDRPVDYVIPEVEGQVYRDIGVAMKNVAIAQEMGYAENYTYTDDLSALDLPEPLEGIRIDFLQANPRGWTGFATHEETGAYCILSYGNNVPMGWTPGAIVCPGQVKEEGSPKAGETRG